MARIQGTATPLTHGICLVDEADLPLVAEWNWWSQLSAGVAYVRGYPLGQWDSNASMYLHRCLHGLGRWRETRLDVDHINRNPLDNRRCNLRVTTRSQNLANSGGRPTKSSRFRGVSWNAKKARWRAVIKVGGRFIDLGVFPCEEDAANAFNVAAKEAWGDYALLNEVGP